MAEGKPVVRWSGHLPWWTASLFLAAITANTLLFDYYFMFLFFFFFLKLLNSILSSHTTGKKKKKKAVRIARGALPVQILPWIFIHGRICSAFAFLWTFLWINSYSSRSLWISKKPSKSMDFICKNVCESSLYFTPLAFNFASWPNILKERNKYAFSPLAHTRISNWLRMGQARVKKSWTAAGIICY